MLQTLAEGPCDSGPVFLFARALSLSIIALVSTIAFLIGRFVASTVMAAIASPWLALAVGLALAAAVASPVLVKSIAESFRKSSDEVEGGNNA